ncbi:MAG: zinc carboxypeptidase [Deltaproteobacteria bacterium]|nr:zinc carboxypeptidase [Deltaproteobacteria bacterium]
MKSVFSFFFFVTFCILGYANPNKSNILSSYWVSPSRDQVMREIARKFEVTRKLNGGYEVIVPLNQTQDLFSLIPEAQLIEFDISSSIRNKTRQELQGYHDFNTVQSHLQTLLNSYPNLTSLEEYGKSLEKRPLLALKVSASRTQNRKPAILLTSSTHGDELITVEVLFGLLETLLSGSKTDSRLSKILENFEIYFIPVVNPDGYVRRERYANGVDPNRDYPWPQDPTHKSNPCISAIMKFYESHQIRASIDFHAFGEMIMYPWAYTYNSLPSFEEGIFDGVTGKMASFNGYTYGQISKVIYVAQGSSADYYHWKHQAWSLGIEVGQQKVPSSSDIPKILKENLDSTWTFIESIK